MIEVKEPTQRELEIQRAIEKENRRKFLEKREKEVKDLKKDVEYLELNYKYRQLRIALANQEEQYQKLLDMEAKMAEKYQAVKEEMDNVPGPVEENPATTTETSTGPHLDTEEETLKP